LTDRPPKVSRRHRIFSRTSADPKAMTAPKPKKTGSWAIAPYCTGQIDWRRCSQASSSWSGQWKIRWAAARRRQARIAERSLRPRRRYPDPGFDQIARGDCSPKHWFSIRRGIHLAATGFRTTCCIWPRPNFGRQRGRATGDHLCPQIWLFGASYDIAGRGRLYGGHPGDRRWNKRIMATPMSIGDPSPKS